MDKSLQNYFHSLLSTSIQNVKLPSNKIRKSEVGHVIYERAELQTINLVRVQKSTETKEIIDNQAIHNVRKKHNI